MDVADSPNLANTAVVANADQEDQVVCPSGMARSPPAVPSDRERGGQMDNPFRGHVAAAVFNDIAKIIGNGVTNPKVVATVAMKMTDSYKEVWSAWTKYCNNIGRDRFIRPSEEEMAAYVTSMGKYKRTTVVKRKNGVMCIFNAAGKVFQRYISLTQRECEGIKAVEVSADGTEYVNLVREFHQMPSGTEQQLRDKAIIAFSLELAARAADCTAIYWPSVKYSSRRIVFRYAFRGTKEFSNRSVKPIGELSPEFEILECGQGTVPVLHQYFELVKDRLHQTYLSASKEKIEKFGVFLNIPKARSLMFLAKTTVQSIRTQVVQQAGWKFGQHKVKHVVISEWIRTGRYTMEEVTRRVRTKRKTVEKHYNFALRASREIPLKTSSIQRRE